MFERNDRISESNILQNHFTAYLVVAVRRTRAKYLRTQLKQQQYEQPLDYDALVHMDMLYSIPLPALLESNTLR